MWNIFTIAESIASIGIWSKNAVISISLAFSCTANRTIGACQVAFPVLFPHL